MTTIKQYNEVVIKVEKTIKNMNKEQIVNFIIDREIITGLDKDYFMRGHNKEQLIRWIFYEMKQRYENTLTISKKLFTSKYCLYCKSDKDSKKWIGCENCDNDRFCGVW